MRRERRVGGSDRDNRPAPESVISGTRAIVVLVLEAFDLTAYLNTADRQLVAPAKVRLHQHADRMGKRADGRAARGGAGAALEPEAAHAGTAADVAFRDRPGLRRIERGGHVFGLHVKTIHVVQTTIVGLGDQR